MLFTGFRVQIKQVRKGTGPKSTQLAAERPVSRMTSCRGNDRPPVQPMLDHLRAWRRPDRPTIDQWPSAAAGTKLRLRLCEAVYS